MKSIFRVFFILILSIVYSHAFDIQTASKIYDKLIYSIFQKKNILVYSKNEIYKEVIKSSNFLILEDNLEKSDIVIITNEDELKDITKEKLAFSTDINIFEINENVIGAFYWKMGRPQIIFSKNRLKNYNLNLLKSFEKYAK